MADKDKMAKYRTEIQQVSLLCYRPRHLFITIFTVTFLFPCARKRWDARAWLLSLLFYSCVSLSFEASSCKSILNAQAITSNTYCHFLVSNLSRCISCFSYEPCSCYWQATIVSPCPICNLVMYITVKLHSIRLLGFHVDRHSCRPSILSSTSCYTLSQHVVPRIVSLALILLLHMSPCSQQGTNIYPSSTIFTNSLLHPHGIILLFRRTANLFLPTDDVCLW